MGNAFTKLFDKLFSKKEMKILMLGLDAAGKTTILYKLHLGEVMATVPTIGFNLETVEYKNIKFQVWDIGGQDKIRNIWKSYFHDNQGLIFVVDSADKERIGEASTVLQSLLTDEDLKDVPLLVYANKQDLGIMTVDEVAEHLGLKRLSREWHIQGTTAIKGEGLYEGMEWLSKACARRK